MYKKIIKKVNRQKIIVSDIIDRKNVPVGTKICYKKSYSVSRIRHYKCSAKLLISRFAIC